MLLFCPAVFAYQSLQELYVQAGPYGEYDRYVELDSTVDYLGDLRILEDITVCLNGNGAVIHVDDYSIGVGVWLGDLDIHNCVLVGGNCGILFSTDASGEIRSNTVTDCQLYGIAVVYPNMQAGVTVWDNIITDSYYGLYCVEYYHPTYIGYNTVFNATMYRYAELCPD